MTSSFLDTPIGRVTPEETLAAANNIKGYAIRTPLVKLDYRRPDNPNLEIWLKLETLQPINSFKLRGAVNKIKNVSSADLQGEVRCNKVSMEQTNHLWSALPMFTTHHYPHCTSSNGYILRTI